MKNNTIFERFPNDGTKIIGNDNQECLAEKAAEKARKQRNLPEGSTVPVWISCPCPKCSPRF